MPVIVLFKGKRGGLGPNSHDVEYVAKPFPIRELLGRVREVLRRHSEKPDTSRRGSASLTFGGWVMDPVGRKLNNPELKNICLSRAEFDLLLIFCDRPFRILSRIELLALLPPRNRVSFERSIDTLVSRIRRKIELNPREPEFLQTVRQVGYCFHAKVKGL